MSHARRRRCLLPKSGPPGSKSAWPTSRPLTSMPSSMRRTEPCSAAAGSTARSIARRARSCARNAKSSAAARPGRPRSRAAIGCRPNISSTPSDRCGGEATPARTSCSPPATAPRLILPPRIASHRSRFRRSQPAFMASRRIALRASPWARSPRKSRHRGSGVARVVFCCFAQGAADHHIGAFAELGLA